MDPAENALASKGPSTYYQRKQAREAIGRVMLAVSELGNAGRSREVSLALTKLEEAEMWIKRHIENNLED